MKIRLTFRQTCAGKTFRFNSVELRTIFISLSYKFNFMDAKVTLSFDNRVIQQAKQYAESQGISLSRLTEILLRKLTTGGYHHFEDFPVADWVNMVSEGEAA